MGASSPGVDEGSDFRECGTVVVARVDVDLGDVELNAMEAVVSSRVCLLADEVRVSVHVSWGSRPAVRDPDVLRVCAVVAGAGAEAGLGMLLRPPW